MFNGEGTFRTSQIQHWNMGQQVLHVQYQKEPKSLSPAIQILHRLKALPTDGSGQKASSPNTLSPLNNQREMLQL